MPYPYTRKSIQEPMSYSFSNCGSRGFFDGYLASRRASISKLTKAVSLPDDPGSRSNGLSGHLVRLFGAIYPGLDVSSGESEMVSMLEAEELSAEGTLDTQQFLLCALLRQRAGQSLTSGQVNKLARIARKFEIFQRVFTYYSSNFRRKSDDSENLLCYSLLSLNLIYRYREVKDSVCLNTVLKINDLLSGLDHDNATEAEALLSATSLEQEMEIIKCLR